MLAEVHKATPEEAKEYGLIDRVLSSTKELPTAIPAGGV